MTFLRELREGSALSERQREALGYIADGLANKEIADRMGTTTDAVKGHVEQLFKKLEARSRAHLVTKGFRAGLLA